MIKHFCDRCGRAAFIPENVKAVLEDGGKQDSIVFDLCTPCVKTMIAWVHMGKDILENSAKKANEVRIVLVNEEKILFSNGSKIHFDHDQDCCENNYADFKQLDSIARASTFYLPLTFERTETGFRFGNSGNMFYVPCYSEQNGYYSDEVDIYFDDKQVFTTKGELKE